VNKLARVNSIATAENDLELAETVKILPRGALETFVRDEKNARLQSDKMHDFGGPNGLGKPLFEVESVHVHTLNFELSAEVTEELNRLNSQGQDVSKILLELLEQRKAKRRGQQTSQAKQTPSHHVPTRVSKILNQEFGTKCSIPNCTKPAQEIHHSQRFAIAKTHDPRFLAPLCHEHHQLAHLIDQKYRDKIRGGNSHELTFGGSR
ncbi:MAG: hypothetical protein WC897_05690, partial [Candidatus Gracilibacteria bacterium]